jgi:hypothetical protein
MGKQYGAEVPLFPSPPDPALPPPQAVVMPVILLEVGEVVPERKERPAPTVKA